MNPPTFLGYKVGEDPQAFLDELYKIVHAMGVTSREKAEFDSYKLKEISQVWMSHGNAFGDMTLPRLMVYDQSIEECMLGRRGRDAKRGRSFEKNKPRSKKMAQNKNAPSSPKVNYERGGGSQVDKPTCSNCLKKHFLKCLADISGFYGWGKDDHRVKIFLLW
ncbi:uncharacterized protein LOC107006220 [Solanum pennellii]|uniref:Uncharacterized protein LOC107006220 n=1 Tax=Solanum pennellii TaxID=28526 RepID=A0ABM1FQQ1_SOLPN|nr:uncharacterized protein LOC107006220 [Solanum pennellii]